MKLNIAEDKASLKQRMKIKKVVKKSSSTGNILHYNTQIIEKKQFLSQGKNKNRESLKTI